MSGLVHSLVALALDVGERVVPDAASEPYVVVAVVVEPRGFVGPSETPDHLHELLVLSSFDTSTIHLSIYSQQEPQPVIDLPQRFHVPAPYYQEESHRSGPSWACFGQMPSSKAASDPPFGRLGRVMLAMESNVRGASLTLSRAEIATGGECSDRVRVPFGRARHP